MKCEICREKIETTFLDKPLGSYIGKKKHLICKNCQKSNSLEDIKKKLNI
mgnify:CR=1 FL=1